METFYNNLVFISLLSIALFIVTFYLGYKWFLKLPSNYFVTVPAQKNIFQTCASNLLASIFLIAGILMLILPGQGTLTIIISLLMFDTKWSRNLAKTILLKSKLLAKLNQMREAKGYEILQLTS